MKADTKDVLELDVQASEKVKSQSVYFFSFVGYM